MPSSSFHIHEHTENPYVTNYLSHICCTALSEQSSCCHTCEFHRNMLPIYVGKLYLVVQQKLMDRYTELQAELKSNKPLTLRLKIYGHTSFARNIWKSYTLDQNKSNLHQIDQLLLPPLQICSLTYT